jgi:serine/threonine protein phosphatase PrpC
MRLDVAGRSDVGKVRSKNDDRFAIKPDLPDGGLLCVVADGMGGYASGDLAATLAVEAVIDGVTAGADLAGAVRAANAEIHRRSQTEPNHQGMGTTITCVLVRDGQAQFVHAGDSRMYLVRDGTARQLTADHSWVADEVRAGRLTAEEARNSSSRNLITRALGMEQDLVVDSGACVLVGGDALLLCSDGVHTLVSEAELVRACQLSAEQGSDELVTAVMARGAPDNATTVIVRVLDGAEQHRGAVTRPLPELAGVSAAGAGPPSHQTASGRRTAAQAPSLSAAGDRRRRRRQWPIVIVLLAALAAIAVILYVGVVARVL